MRILFICCSLEPGKDGVGDYIRRLAVQLVNVGHEVRLLALNDSHLLNVVEGLQTMEGKSIKTFRFDLGLSWNARSVRARLWIEAFSPDWISLQFVCFGFNSKGFVHDLVKPLSRICEGYRIHWMFHELWVGIDADARLKLRVWGWFQRHFILSLYTKIRPQITHTSNSRYKSILGKYNIQSDILPLFGNIPFPRQFKSDRDDLSGFCDLPTGKRLKVGLFGSIHPQWSPFTVLDSLQEFCAESQLRLALIAFGRHGPKGEELFLELRRSYGDRFDFVKLGLLSESKVGEILSHLDIGLATSPLSLLGKSGTVAAFADFGIAIVVNRVDENELDCSSTEVREGVVLFKPETRVDWKVILNRRRSVRASVVTVAEHFTLALSGAARGRDLVSVR